MPDSAEGASPNSHPITGKIAPTEVEKRISLALAARFYNEVHHDVTPSLTAALNAEDAGLYAAEYWDEFLDYARDAIAALCPADADQQREGEAEGCVHSVDSNNKCMICRDPRLATLNDAAAKPDTSSLYGEPNYTVQQLIKKLETSQNLWNVSNAVAMLLRLITMPKPAQRPVEGWVRKEDFGGSPNTDPLVWWCNEYQTGEPPELDEILLGADGKICGKGGCGADHFTHVMLAGFERPPAPIASKVGV